MGAGLPQHLVKNRIRYRLKKLAAANNGTYAKFIASGVKDGLAWKAGIGVVRASNGESFGMDHIEITGPAGARCYGYSLEKALYSYGVDTAEAAPQGEPGAYSALFTWPGFFQTWSWRGCVALDSWSHTMKAADDRTGFTLFDTVNRRELRITGAEADSVAPLFYREIRPNVRIETIGKSYPTIEALRKDYFLAAARADGIDRLIDLYANDPRWQPSDDWRAKPGNEFGNPGKIPFGLQKPGLFPQPGQGEW